MLSNAPEMLALGYRLAGLNDRMRKLRQLSDLTRELLLTQHFPELPAHLDSLLAQAENEYLDLLSAQQAASRAAHYEVSVADAAEAIQVSENTIRKWDVEGCPDDPSYPGRFRSVVFYQWAVTYRSLKRFNREAKKSAVRLNAAQT